MELLADRFWAEGDRAIDLATGARVTVTVTSAGGASEQQRWTERCDRLAALHHPDVARLIDFGLVGEARRFEAWRGVDAGVSAPVVDEAVRLRANRFLTASGFEPTRAARVLTDRGREVVLPDADAGYPLPMRLVAADDDVNGGEPLGVERIDRPAVSAVAEVLIDSGRREPCAIALWGERGVGLRTALADVARVARRHGLVPLTTAIEDGPIWDSLADRSVLIIDEAGDGRGWRRLIAAGLRSVRSHLLLIAAREETRHVHNLRLERVSTDRLVSAVCPAAVSGRRHDRVERAAVQSNGLPGLFVQHLWAMQRPAAGVTGSVARGEPTASRVAEPTATYDVAPRLRGAQPPVRRAWPVPGEVTALRRQLDRALETLAGGRLAAADREIRASASALMRRGDCTSGARALLRLSGAWLRRGCLDAAQSAVDEAGEQARRVDDDPALIDAALLLGRIHLDRGEPAEAELVLRGGVAAARARDDDERAAEGRVALSRVLFWQGRFDEAARQLDHLGSSSESMRLRANLVRAEIAVGQRELARAVTLATATLDRVETVAPLLVAQAGYTVAFTHLAVGDHGAVLRDVDRAIAAARQTRDPLLSLLVRLLAAECHRRCGRQAPAAALLARLGRVKRPRLPVTLSARVEVLRTLMTGAAGATALDRVVTRFGLPAVRLFAPESGSGGPLNDLTEALEILHLCQASDDEMPTLVRLCVALRRALRASVVAVVAPLEGGVTLAVDGRGLDRTLAERIGTTGQPLCDVSPTGGTGVGAPIRLAGRELAALVARWTAGATVDTARAVSLLTLSAVAASPLVAALTSRLVSPVHDDGIVGTSPAMADIRRAIERAATAPYPVLVEGESGCGKELIARAVHRRSARRDRSFCAVNCAALPDDLLEAELFGHARGAFTGAVTDRSGVFEEAHGGTLFLDEVGELSPRAQAKLLRVMQDGELRRVGESSARRVDVRIVAATNRDLRHEVAAGRFRLDLLYRLDVIRITVPPLRERPDDIPLLVVHFWRETTERLRSRAVLSAQTIAALAQHSWPGNVRELQNVLAAMAVHGGRRGVVGPSALPTSVAQTVTSAAARLSDARRSFDERYIRAALTRCAGHRGRAAAELGVTRQGLTKLLDRLGIAERSQDEEAATP